METSKRTKKETIELFRRYQHEFEKLAHRSECELAKQLNLGRAESYELAAFEIESNSDWSE